MVKRIAALAGAIVAVALVATATPAGAQQYPPADNRLTVSAACEQCRRVGDVLALLHRRLAMA